MRSGVLPRWSGLVLIIGLLLTFGGQLSHGSGILAAAVLGIGLVWMGYALWSERRPPVGSRPSPSRREKAEPESPGSAG